MSELCARRTHRVECSLAIEIEWVGRRVQQVANLAVTTRRRDECFAGNATVMQAVSSQSLFFDQRDAPSQTSSNHGGNQASGSGTNTDQVVIAALRILPIIGKGQLLQGRICAVHRFGVH